MDVLTLSRIQFAMAAFFHFLFVPLTLGLVVLVAVMETLYVRTGDREYLRMARFWGRLFLINFVIGIVTGLTLEFQFGTNWSRYSAYVGDIFGSLLAIEATAAFFLESTFIAIWAFGWKRLSARMHLIAIWVLAVTTHVSAFWILAANAWMQHPVGYVLRNGRAELADFSAVISQEYLLHQLVHTLSGAQVLGAFFVMGISAWHILRKNEIAFFMRSFRLACVFAFAFSAVEVVQGHMNGALVAKHQPQKLAAMEALWESQESWAPQTLLLLPHESKERNLFEFGKLPGALSLLAYHRFDAPVKGLKEWPREDRPPVLINFLAFRAMVALGFLFPLVAAIGLIWSFRDELRGLHPVFRSLLAQVDRFPQIPWIFVLAIPLPYIAIECGWCLTEVGRQPWIVYGLMRTADAVSSIPVSQVLVSVSGFFVLYSLLGGADFYLLAKVARRGPAAAGEDGHA